jgi:uncharacterized protein YifN (PemK superfamily)
VDIDIHGYIRMWISCFGHVMDVSMDILQQFKVANSKFSLMLPHYGDSDIISMGIKKTLLNVNKRSNSVYYAI